MRFKSRLKAFRKMFWICFSKPKPREEILINEPCKHVYSNGGRCLLCGHYSNYPPYTQILLEDKSVTVPQCPETGVVDYSKIKFPIIHYYF